MGKRKADESTHREVIEKEEILEKKINPKDGVKKKKFSDSHKQGDNVSTVHKDPENMSQQHGIKRKTFEKNGNTPSVAKKPDWLKLKEKKKVLKVERKKKKSLFELSVKAKQLWEQLRRKNNSKDKSMELVKELHSLLKGNYAKAVFSHDVGRVVQWLLKMGTKEVHAEIAMELKGHLVEMAQSKYGSFCVKQLLKRGSKEIKNTVIASCFGNVVKLMSHRVSSPLLSNIYSTYANSLQKCHFRQEFYCDIYRVMKHDEVKSLKLALEVSKEMNEAILGTTKGNLLKVINKELVESQLVNTVLGEFISLSNVADRTEVISAISSFLPLLTQTKEGAKVGMMCLWHGTQKDRKVVVKSLKGNVSQIAVCDHGYLVLLSLFDCVDDTVLVKKALISELLENILDIAKNKNGRRVILYLVAPRDPSYFHPDVVEMLKLGDDNAHSKKPTDIRRAELLSAVSEPLLDSITKNIEEWFSDNSVGMVALAVLKAGKGDKLKDAFEALALYVCKGKEDKDVDSEDSTNALEDPGLHLILKKLILYDKLRLEQNCDEVLFGEIFVSSLNEDLLQRVMSSNRGCFILVKLLEVDIPKITKMLKKKLKGNVSGDLAKLKSKGGEVLRDKLKE